MTILTEGRRTAEFLVSEASYYRSRDGETITVPANTTYEPGTIMGKITASGKFVRHDAGASDGSQNEAGVLYAGLTNDTGSGVDMAGTIIARDAEINSAELTYEAGADAAQITTSNAALVALGLIVR